MGPYRAPGAPSVIFALDSVMDELAQRLKIDPIEIRLRNAARGGDLMANDEAWPTIGMTQVLKALRDHPAWKNRAEARAKGYGVGISVGGWPGGTEPAAAACSLNRDGLLHIHVGSVDLTGTNTGFTRMAAEVFGVSPDQVRVTFSDTDTAPYSQGQLLSGSWLDYIVPRIHHTPRFETVIVEVPSDHGPLGVRGVGETPVVPTAAAIANAIADTIGARLTDLPLTPPRVLAAIQSIAT